MILNKTNTNHVHTSTTERYQSDPAGRGQWFVSAKYQRPACSFDGGFVP